LLKEVFRSSGRVGSGIVRAVVQRQNKLDMVSDGGSRVALVLTVVALGAWARGRSLLSWGCILLEVIDHIVLVCFCRSGVCGGWSDVIGVRKEFRGTRHLV